MTRIAGISRLAASAVLLVGLTGCGLTKYPGQPGVVTDGYSRVDLEDLEEDGLFVYEVSYDNQNNKGTGAVITKLYPGAQTYTSNVRTNADGTVYRVKGAYEGAEVQMIALPQQNQIVLSPNHKLQLFVDYETSMDEVDSRNIAEEKIFKPTLTSPNMSIPAALKQKWELMRAGRLMPNGVLSYEIQSVELGEQKFTPSRPVTIETSFFQNALRTNTDKAMKAEAKGFLEKNFPKGYSGTVLFHVKGVAVPLSLKLGLNTVKTYRNAGKKIVENASAEEMEAIVARYSNHSH